VGRRLRTQQELGMIDSGDARTKGIGAMSLARLKSFND
jgi:hypothetical protein